GDWSVRELVITARDKRQYGSVAYALRAILAVQQDALLEGTSLLPLDDAAVELFKESIDLVSLAALQTADQRARFANRQRLNAADLSSAWSDIVKHGETHAPAAKTAPATQTEKFATIKAIVAEKLTA